MILTQVETMNSILNQIQKELLEHHRTPEELFESCVKERLINATRMYDKEISEATNYLNARQCFNMMRRLTKEKIQ